MSSGVQLRAVHLDRQLVELGGKGERRLVVRVVHAGQRVGADVEALVPLQDHRQRVRHGNGLDSFAVHLERAGAAAAEAAHVIEGERAQAEAVILEVELQRVLAGRERVRAFPLDAFQVNQVPEEHRFALEQVEAVAGKPAARSQDHALGAAFRHFDVRRDGVGAVEKERGIALRQAGHGARVHELGAAGGDVRARGHDAGGHRGVQREHLVFLRFAEEQLLQFLHLFGILSRHVVHLGEVLVQVIEFPRDVVDGVRIGRAEGLPRRADDLGARQPAFVIDGVVAHHFEVLGLVPGRRVGVGLVEGVGEAHAFDRALLDAVHIFGAADAGQLRGSSARRQ